MRSTFSVIFNPSVFQGQTSFGQPESFVSFAINAGPMQCTYDMFFFKFYMQELKYHLVYFLLPLFLV